jgi:RNA polymerase sigma-70 factor (ECF subfamily)
MSRTECFADETLPYFAELLRAARRYAGPRPDLAEDLVQETYLRAFAARDRYRPGSNARAWLHAILTNAAHTQYRRDRRDARLRERVGEQGAADEEASDPTPALSTPSLPLRALLDALPAPYRQAVELVDLGGLSYHETAVRLRCPVGTVMSRLHRARRRLRSALPESLRPAAAVVVAAR